MSSARLWPALADVVLLGALVASGLLPVPMLLLGLSVPLALVASFAALDSLFSSTLPGADTSALDLQGRALGFVAYATAAGSLVLALTGDWHWTAWYALGFALVYAFARLWRDSVRHGSLFPYGYAPVWWDAAALAAGLAASVWLDVGPAELAALPLLVVRLLGELVTVRREPVEAT